MHHLGIISSTTYSEEILSDFEKSGFTLRLLDKEAIYSEELSGIFIEETENCTISSICELILLIRRKSEVLIWILSTKACGSERQIYLQLGVDIVFDRNFFPMEPLLTIKNHFSRKKFLEKTEQIKLLDNQADKRKLRLNASNLSLYVVNENGKEKEINLTRLEYRTLAVLNNRPGETVTYKEIYESTWRKPYSNKQHRVSNLIFHIRGKLDKEATASNYIRTIRSKGYMLDIY